MDERIRELKSRAQPGDRELVHGVLQRIGDKWSVMVIIVLARQARRFTELLEAVPGISRRMLTVTLRQLERDGLVERVTHTEPNPWMEYTVTDMGRSIREPLATVLEWVLDHRDEILEHRARYDSSQITALDSRS
jgi:DNA-binding HxlR family transcriptional regulator